MIMKDKNRGLVKAIKPSILSDSMSFRIINSWILAFDPCDFLLHKNIKCNWGTT